MNWNEVDKIRAQHGLDTNFNHLPEEAARQANIHRGQLLDFLYQFRPHPFDPENRKTWPEIGKEVLIKTPHVYRSAVLKYDSQKAIFAWTSEAIWYRLDWAIEWQNLPGEVQQ